MIDGASSANLNDYADAAQFRPHTVSRGALLLTNDHPLHEGFPRFQRIIATSWLSQTFRRISKNLWPCNQSRVPMLTSRCCISRTQKRPNEAPLIASSSWPRGRTLTHQSSLTPIPPTMQGTPAHQADRDAPATAPCLTPAQSCKGGAILKWLRILRSDPGSDGQSQPSTCWLFSRGVVRNWLYWRGQTATLVSTAHAMRSDRAQPKPGIALQISR